MNQPRDRNGRFACKPKEFFEISYSLIPWILILAILATVVFFGNFLPDTKEKSYNEGVAAGAQNLSQEREKAFYDGFAKGKEYANWTGCSSYYISYSSEHRLFCNGNKERAVDRFYNLIWEWDNSKNYTWWTR